jgi:NTP pyrophosphatase (non-canonical NTP hydrolase)
MIEEYEKLIIQWAAERGLNFKENEKSQLLKTLEELGEVSRAVLKYDHEGLKDGIGDVIVTLIILANINGLNIEQCLSKAWTEIKDRRGKTVNGSFIKQ